MVTGRTNYIRPVLLFAAPGMLYFPSSLRIASPVMASRFIWRNRESLSGNIFFVSLSQFHMQGIFRTGVYAMTAANALLGVLDQLPIDYFVHIHRAHLHTFPMQFAQIRFQNSHIAGRSADIGLSTHNCFEHTARAGAAITKSSGFCLCNWRRCAPVLLFRTRIRFSWLHRNLSGAHNRFQVLQAQVH